MKLAIAAVGDPASERTWSGTPSNLMRALRAEGVDCAGLDTEPKTLTQRISAGAIAHLKRHCEPLRSESARAWLGSRTVEGVARTGCDAVLHMGTLTVPLEAPSSVPQFAYLDSTWRQWRACNETHQAMGYRELQETEGAESRAVHQLAHIFCTSKACQESLISDYAVAAERTSVVGTGRGKVDAFHGEKDFGARSILFVAKARERDKGLYLLVDAFHLASRINKELSLHLIVSTQTARTIPAHPNIRVHSDLPWPELQSLFNSASLYAMPALGEPWGLVYIEALAARTPVLGLNRYAFPELAGHGAFGFVITEPTPAAVSDGIVSAFSDTARLDRMGRAGQAHVTTHFTWERVAAAISSTINRLVK